MNTNTENTACARLDACNARGIAFHVEQGEPFGGIGRKDLSVWLRSVADQLENQGMQIATLEAVNAKERQVVEVLHHSIKKYLAHRNCTCDECRLLQNEYDRTVEEQNQIKQ